jgi:hypothetical protein
MEESGGPIALKVQTLSDLELAVLICFVAEQHCIIEADDDLTNDVAEEMKMVIRTTFAEHRTETSRLPVMFSD